MAVVGECFEDLVGGLGPYEGSRVLVPFLGPGHDVAFEVEDGKLCVNIRRHAKTAGKLDDLCEHAGTVAKRIRDELAE